MDTKETERMASSQMSLSKARNFGTEMIKIPRLIADRMKEKFRISIAPIFRSKNVGFKEIYTLSLDNLEDMLWVVENDKDTYNHIRIHFTHYKDEFSGSYSQLSGFENSLCLMYSRALDRTELNEYNAIYSSYNQVHVRKGDLDVVKQKFEALFQSLVGGTMTTGEGYTSFVMIPRIELLAYYSKILLYNKYHNDNKIVTINVCLASTLEAAEIRELETYGIENGEIEVSSLEVKKLIDRAYSPNQLTVVFDSIDESNKVVDNVSDYDMNSLCPNQCP